MVIIQCFFPRTKVSGKPNEELQSERRSGESFSEAICNRLRRTLTYCVLWVVSLAFFADNNV